MHLYKFQATILACLLIIGKFNFYRKISKAAVILGMEVVIIYTVGKSSTRKFVLMLKQ